MQRCRSFFAMKAIANLSWVLREHHAGCRLPTALLPARWNQLPDAVRSRNPSKSTLAHDAVAAVVLHEHHLIIRVGAGLIQIVYQSHSHLVTEFTRHTKPWPEYRLCEIKTLNQANVQTRCQTKMPPVGGNCSDFLRSPPLCAQRNIESKTVSLNWTPIPRNQNTEPIKKPNRTCQKISLQKCRVQNVNSEVKHSANETNCTQLNSRDNRWIYFWMSTLPWPCVKRKFRSETVSQICEITRNVHNSIPEIIDVFVSECLRYRDTQAVGYVTSPVKKAKRSNVDVWNVMPNDSWP